MSEKFDIGETFGEYSNLEKVLEDTVLAAATKEAQRRAAVINATNADILYNDQSFDENTKELDLVTAHLFGNQLLLSGNIQVCSEGDDAQEQYVDQIVAKFAGFGISRRNGTLHYDYLYQAVIDEEQNFLSKNHLEDNISKGTRTGMQIIQAKTDQVFMEFTAMHPVRALAVLEVIYPHALKDIDEMIIGPIERSEEEKIARLGELSVSLEGMDTEEIDSLKVAVETYIDHVVDLDREVPYSIFLDGEYYLNGENEERGAIRSEHKVTLFSAQSWLMYTRVIESSAATDELGPGEYLQVAIVGSFHAMDQLEQSQPVIVPASSIKDIRSLRTTFI